MKILVCNFGSSSLKMTLFAADTETRLAWADVDWSVNPPQLVYQTPSQSATRESLADNTPRLAVSRILELLQTESGPLANISELSAVGHRVVHGGTFFPTTVAVDDTVKQQIEQLKGLAPLHQPANLLGIELFETLLPQLPQFATFDTAFHATLSPAAYHYPVPQQWSEQWGIRRFGFHGLSHQYCSQRAAELLGRDDLKLVIAHLGSGASVSAVDSGVCRDTSMGFTPLDGLMMGTRCGAIDPGILFYVQQERGLSVDEVQRVLEHESGLLGVSGIAADMRQVLAQQSSSAPARLAVEIYVHRVRQTIGAMVATLGGIDALVFTAGVGEHSPEIRERVCEDAKWLGIEIDKSANQQRSDDCDVALPDARCRVLVISTREDMTVLRQTRALMQDK